ncbi:MAG TPA: hypothetical protein VNV43_12465 [Candidatus Acidoferrales bacterium]|nr:hypothetical protein [Candidatus Acidoferrales bacterium]
MRTGSVIAREVVFVLVLACRAVASERRRVLPCLISLLGFPIVGAPAAEYVNSELPWHPLTVDSQDHLLAWYQPEQNLGYDKVLHLAWDFLETKVPDDPKTHLKIYLINAVYDAKTLQGVNWQGNPASTFAQFVDSVVAWYPYSGDDKAVAVVRSMLDHQLAHGTTPAFWNWPMVPFATTGKNDPNYGRSIRGMPLDFFGGIETDKVGELGMGYCLFYELTGDQKYLTAAMHCADALASHVRFSDDTQTPWPFRVNAQDGSVINDEDFGGMIVAPVRLFSELIRLNKGNVKEYTRVRRVAWSWILRYPVHNNRWSGYFEDVTKDTNNVNQACPTMTAYYILSAPDPAAVDPHWTGDVGHMIDWVRQKFGCGPYFGAWAINEQGEPPDYCGCCSRAGLGSDTSRWAAINAMYYEKTGDAQAREDAFRSLNYATYFADDQGRIACCGLDYADSYWFDDGYSDYIRNFLWAMGAMPELAPLGQNHLLCSSSVVQKVEYATNSISYQTFDSDAIDVLRLNQAPTHVRAGGNDLARVDVLTPGGYTVSNLPKGGVAVRVQHTGASNVTVSW